MLHETLPVTKVKFYLVYKTRNDVKERNIYFFPTNDNVINICKYAKSEGADYICYKYDSPTANFIPILSTDKFDCVAIIRNSDFSGNIKKCVMNAIEKEKDSHRNVIRRCYISPVKTLRIMEEMRYCGLLHNCIVHKVNIDSIASDE